ncbi:MAG: restriction endonuclease subunit S, partial [Mariprofundaceae bacterium]|nr:restriction endonuclease subunit S [Mariprofundaceae bacterium]
ENLQKNISYQNLVAMFTFDRVDFEKNISLSAKKKVILESKWKVVKIGKVCETSSGGTPLSGTPEYYENANVLWVNSGEVRQGVIIHSQNKITELGLKKSSAKIFPKDTVLLAMYGATAGQVGILAVEASTNQAVCGILPNPNISPQYLFNFLKTQYENILAMRSGVARLNLSQDIVKNIKIPLPPKDIQQKIVTEIEKLEKQEQNAIQEVERQWESITENFIGLKQQKVLLGNIAQFKNGLNYNRKSLGEEITIVGVGDFKNDFTPNVQNLEKVQIEGELSKNYELKQKDILVVRSNGSARLVGRFLYICKLKDKTSFSGFTIRIRVNSKDVDSKFLCHYLKTDIVRDKLTKDSKGSNIKSLNQGLLSSVKIPLPTISEQKKIVSEIEKIEIKIAALKKEISTIPAQKEAILKKYLE